jgi:hypothetical protein
VQASRCLIAGLVALTPLLLSARAWPGSSVAGELREHGLFAANEQGPGSDLRIAVHETFACIDRNRPEFSLLTFEARCESLRDLTEARRGSPRRPASHTFHREPAAWSGNGRHGNFSDRRQYPAETASHRSGCLRHRCRRGRTHDREALSRNQEAGRLARERG